MCNRGGRNATKGHTVNLTSTQSQKWMKCPQSITDEMKIDWTIYADAGLLDKTEKELESRNTSLELPANQFLTELYGRTENLLQVWRLLKVAFPKTANNSYLNMIKVLVKRNDLPTAEKCYKEWASTFANYDIRIANVLIGAYLNLGSFEKAETLKERAQRRATKPNAKTWELYLDYFLKRGDMKSVVDCVERAISAGRGDGGKWAPSPAMVSLLMQHYEHSKNVEGAEGFLEILNKSTYKLGSEVFEALIRTYAAAGKKSASISRRIKMAHVELSEECKKLLVNITE